MSDGTGINRAMIFAAGLGTRLRPITENIPKALVKIHGKTLLEILIEKLLKIGIKEIVINVHHYDNLIQEYLKQNKYFGANIKLSFEKEKLLNTGGGLKRAQKYLDRGEPFLIHNVDIISNIDLFKLFERHKVNRGIATLAVADRESSRYFLTDKNGFLCGWENIKTGEKIITREVKGELYRKAFSGIHVVEPDIFCFMPKKSVFSIVDVYLEISKNNEIFTFTDNRSIWFDVGTVEKLKEAEAGLKIEKLL